MNESHPHGGPSNGHNVAIPGGPGQPALHFSDAEWQQFRQSDVSAGKSVVMLMGCIFGVGLVLYSIVAYVCWFRVM